MGSKYNLKTSQAIAYLLESGVKISPKQMQRLTQSGEITAFSENNRNYYSTQSLDNYLESNSLKTVHLHVKLVKGDVDEPHPPPPSEMNTTFCYLSESSGAARSCQQILNHIDGCKWNVSQIRLPLSANKLVIEALAEHAAATGRVLFLTP